ncbi:hypothetical protein [Desulfosporosinus meridiei]|uniref:DUF4083 domain-containing protein n=1 Tax=Desulfosporosinus meridiei (strain ATCC BAA-275 / DSM 13257 / KCTC 12902 / NCIMB 13706 / S10) TaxID=768704 RepID=J7INT5_DESMD|nr:hypothetical protein [Desulfosporosinus meridiei]AFQ43502.1 hypothetical protein Desmer_1509 [Desulfosporosinus meridiei DSM 13257]
MGDHIIIDYQLLLFLIFSLGSFVFVGFIVYMMVKASQFLKRKALNDKEVLQKMDELIKLLQLSDKRV